MILAAARYSQIAWVMATMCDSVNVPSRDVPRCPLVPNATSCSGFGDVGLLVVIVGEQFRHVDQERLGRRLAGERGERHRFHSADKPIRDDRDPADGILISAI